MGEYDHNFGDSGLVKPDRSKSRPINTGKALYFSVRSLAQSSLILTHEHISDQIFHARLFSVRFKQDILSHSREFLASNRFVASGRFLIYTRVCL